MTRSGKFCFSDAAVERLRATPRRPGGRSGAYLPLIDADWKYMGRATGLRAAEL